MAKTSSGIMIYKFVNSDTLFGQAHEIKFFLVHPGGPFFKNKNARFWTIAKGELEEGEEALNCAVRELKEETGYEITDRTKLVSLGDVTQKSGKKVIGFAYEIPAETNIVVDSNKIEIEFPPRSGKKMLIPEIDKGEFFDIEVAKKMINSAQVEFIDRLIGILEEKI